VKEDAIGDGPIFAIDPGRDTGISWSLRCTYLLGTVNELISHAMTFKAELRAYYGPNPHKGLKPTAVIELPRVYPNTQKEDPNDLFTLAVRVGAYTMALDELGFRVLSVHPRDWKGTLPKNAHHARLLRDYPDLGRAVDVNVSAVTKRHNAYDAFGLLVWCDANRKKTLRVLTRDLFL
jgi:hypothetical protein